MSKFEKKDDDIDKMWRKRMELETETLENEREAGTFEVKIENQK